MYQQVQLIDQEGLAPCSNPFLAHCRKDVKMTVTSTPYCIIINRDREKAGIFECQLNPDWLTVRNRNSLKLAQEKEDDFNFTEFRNVCYHAQWLSPAELSAMPWTVACQTPLSLGFPKLEYWSGLPFPPPGDLPNPEIEPASLMSPALAGEFFPASATWEA